MLAYFVGMKYAPFRSPVRHARKKLEDFGAGNMQEVRAKFWTAFDDCGMLCLPLRPSCFTREKLFGTRYENKALGTCIPARFNTSFESQAYRFYMT